MSAINKTSEYDVRISEFFILLFLFDGEYGDVRSKGGCLSTALAITMA